MPDLLHVIPVGDNAVLNGLLEGEDAPLGLGLVSDIRVLERGKTDERGCAEGSFVFKGSLTFCPMPTMTPW